MTPPLLISNIVLREVCNNIFKDMMEVENSRNHAIHLENYEDKWKNLREVVNIVLDDL
jgi:hypothetical protein